MPGATIEVVKYKHWKAKEDMNWFWILAFTPPNGLCYSKSYSRSSSILFGL